MNTPALKIVNMNDSYDRFPANADEPKCRPIVTDNHVHRIMDTDAVPNAISLANLLGDEVSAGLMQEIWDHTMEGVVVTNKYGDIVHLNIRAERVFGYRTTDVLGLTLAKVISKSLLDDFLATTALTLDFDKVQGVRRNGSVLPIKVKMNRVSVCSHSLWIIFIHDMSEVQQQRREIERLTHVDTLTGLPNRNLLQERMNQTLASGLRYRRSFAFIYIDLDKFKQVNDNHGHAMGDRVLKEMGRRLKSCVRETDTVARIGGDEFAALLTDLKNEDDVRIVADRFLNICRQPVVVGNATFQLGTSMGIAVFPTDGNDLESIRRHADAAMFHAKNNGRDQYAFYTRELNSTAERKTMIVQGLHRALNCGGLLLHYQPQVDLYTGEMIGAEALMRWNDNGVIIQPGEFIPVAEESGLIIPMGEWALREACHKGQLWRQMGLGAGRGIRVAVNLSVHQFTDSFPDMVFSVLRETGLPPELLDLEITESFLAKDRLAKSILQRLQDGGIHLSVDDFGTGYSCLAYLKDLPLDTIKIDRYFVKDLGGLGTTNNHAVVESIVTLAHKLGRSTLAEGIETPEQARILKNMGVLAGQGFMFSRPLPADEFELFAWEAGFSPLEPGCRAKENCAVNVSA